MLHLPERHRTRSRTFETERGNHKMRCTSVHLSVGRGFWRYTPDEIYCILLYKNFTSLLLHFKIPTDILPTGK